MIAAGFVVCGITQEDDIGSGGHDQLCRRRTVRRRPMLKQTAGTNVFPAQSRHGCSRKKSGQPTKARTWKAGTSNPSLGL